MRELILVGAGKGGMAGEGSGPFGDPSPMNAVYDAIIGLELSVDTMKADWNTPDLAGMVRYASNLVLVCHSFFCNSAYLLCQELCNENREYSDDNPLDNMVTVIMVEPVRWTFKDDVNNVKEFNDSALAQVLDHTPFEMPANVKACYVFRRSQVLGPITNPVEPTVFDKNVDGDHNTAVASATPEILDIIKALY